MLRRRLTYLGALVFAFCFYLFYPKYLAWYLLLFLLCLPALSLALSLPGIFRLSLHLSAAAPSSRRGGAVEAELSMVDTSTMFVARITGTLTVKNGLTGEAVSAPCALPAGPGVYTARRSFPADHCGQLCLSAAKLRAQDYLGLFSLPLPGAEEYTLLCLPVPAPPEELPILPSSGGSAPLRPRPGGGPGEDYELRPYRPGDPMRQVHWKLSTKLDELVVRETLEERRGTAAVAYDLPRDPGELDLVLDRASWFSSHLLERGVSHTVFTPAPGGRVRMSALREPRDLEALLEELLSAPGGVGLTLPQNAFSQADFSWVYQVVPHAPGVVLRKGGAR